MILTNHFALLLSPNESFVDFDRNLNGSRGVPWFKIIENEFECPANRWALSNNFAEKFAKKYCS